MKNKYKAMVLSCMDPRFQPIVYNYLKKKKLNGKYSAFTIAGSAIGVTASKFKKWHQTFWDNIDTSIKLHNIKKLIVINHCDCGAAKIINGQKNFNAINEKKIHHEPLVQLLPEDTSCDDIFGEVDAGRSINSQFLPSEDSHIHREVLRFTRKIEQWLKEEKALTKVKEKQAKRDAWHAAYKEKQAAKKPKLEPPAPPVMAFSDAQIVAEHTANKKLEFARERLLEKGYTGRFRVPGDNASPHQKFFKESPQAVCKQLGIEFVGEKFGMYIIYFPGTALEAFEKAKREVKSKVSGKGKNKIVTPMPYRNYKLPTTGEVITWQDFFGTLIARAYVESDIAAFKIVTKHSSAEIEAMGKAKVREVQSKYEVKLERASTEIADCELKHEQAKDSAVKEALAKQLESHRAARNALLAKQDEEITALELQYDGYKEMARTREKLIAERTAKSQEAAAALFRRRDAAGGATAEDGAAALAAVAGTSGVVPAPPTAEAQVAMPLAADESDDGLDGF